MKGSYTSGFENTGIKHVARGLKTYTKSRDTIVIKNHKLNPKARTPEPACLAAKEALHLSQLLKDIGYNEEVKPLQIAEDNAAVKPLQIAEDNAACNRTSFRGTSACTESQAL
jgi:hypothetical protein